ncbi:hypothetical protein N7470_004528 [Penicillium chermesinum]|nr:hypothetical protein N7470_004528 [Penicillium chermesinum]
MPCPSGPLSAACSLSQQQPGAPDFDPRMYDTRKASPTSHGSVLPSLCLLKLSKRTISIHSDAATREKVARALLKISPSDRKPPQPLGFGSTGSTAFGSGNTGTGNTGGSLFGGTGAFGNTNSGGGQNRTPGFGTTNTSTGGSLFGGTATTGNNTFGSSGGGAFGSGTTGGFGSNAAGNTGGGLFGKSAGGFGSTTNTNTAGGFGSGGGFGSTTTPASTGFGGSGIALQGALQPCEGTGSTPFSPFTEKDTSSATMNHYQSISFMQPYSRFSPEELRLADYQAGRRFGNGSGQAGAFGSSAFGGTAGGFGSQQNNTTGFGASTTPFGGAATSQPAGGFGATQTTGGFGATANNNSGSSLFGANKPATSMFGGGTTGTTGGSSLFGGNTGSTGNAFGSGTAAGGFGSTNNTGGSSLFGANNQQKPAFGSTTTGTGFGGGGFGAQQQTSSSNPFGGTPATTTPFGGQQQQSGGLGGFGQNQNQNKPGGLFGGASTGFGASNNTQGQSGSSLFGNTPAAGNTGGGLFGQSQPQQQNTGGGLFGGGQNQASTAGGGLFGQQNNQAKPGGLFGSGGTTTTGGGGLFGNSQPQPATGGGLFGASQNNQQQKPGGLFGNSTGGTGSSLFGNQNNSTQQGGSSLFGNQSQQQPAGGSLFGNSQPAPQQSQPVPGSLTSSLLEGNPYGNQSIFSGLPAPNAPSPGPLATPLSASMKQKQRTPLPVHQMVPQAANRLVTPPRRQGYGFSYSTYGSPASAGSTPGFSGSLLGAGASNNSFRGSLNGGSFGRSFSKSYSTSNLRKTFDPDSNSVLSPARPASASPAPLTNGDDAASGDKLKKKVSFDSSSPTVSGDEIVPVETRSPEPTPAELGFLRSTRKSGTLNGIDSHPEQPEMESVGRDLAVVPENDEPSSAEATAKRMAPFFPHELKHVQNFTVGRQHCGQVTFDVPVDLTNIDIDDIFNTIVDIGVRRITVYPDETVKPPRGKGLNVPSTLCIQNSWPRGRDRKKPAPITTGPLLVKHIERLKRVADTEFKEYDPETGTWIFSVPHFTTYGLDYDEDEEGETLDQSTLAVGPPDSGTPKAHRDHPVSFEQSTTFSIDDSFVGSMVGVDDDTFDFKKRKIIPGSFGSQAEDQDMTSEIGTESFLEEGSTGSATEHDDDFVTESQVSGDSVVGSDEDQEMDMAGSFPTLHRSVEQDDDQTTYGDLDTTQPILKPLGTPPKPRLDLSGDWTEQLQRTISPRKQNRDALREIQASAFTNRPLLNDGSPVEKTSSPKKGFTNSIDLMNSLFQQQPRKQAAPSPLKASQSQPKAFEWPYNKQPKSYADDTTTMDQADADFHDCFKPRWGPQQSIICVKNETGDTISGIHNRWQDCFTVFGEDRDITVMQSILPDQSKGPVLDVQRVQSTIQQIDGIPLARLSKPDLAQFALSPTANEERLIWQLTNILFNDELEDDISAGVPPQLRPQFAHRIKKDRLSRLWESIIRERHTHALERIRSPEERAVHLLCSHRIQEACKVLVESQNLHLATVVAQIGRDATSRGDIANQIEVWRQNNVLSEMTEPVRALYELVAGNSLFCDGKTGGALEDRATAFLFTERFDLDWLQAFGLRLWYGITEDEPLEAAVSKFLKDLSTGQEPAFPRPAHEAHIKTSVQPGSDTLGRESPLWVLLKVYAASKGETSIPAIELPAALLPESLSGDLLSNRISFQLHHVLSAVVGQSESIKINQYQADRLVSDYASELLSAGEIALGLSVLLYLSQSEERKRSLQETLARFGAHLPAPTISESAESDPLWVYFTEHLQLPEAWIWVAKALHARDTGNATREVDYLIRGKHWNDAHATFCRIVGPTAIISRDYDTLERLITGFGETPERKMRGWASGGGIYEDFLRLVTATRGRRDPIRLARLVNALVATGDNVRNHSGVEGLEERVAFKEMSRAVASWITHEDVHSIQSSTILRLPLTGDARICKLWR